MIIQYVFCVCPFFVCFSNYFFSFFSSSTKFIYNAINFEIILLSTLTSVHTNIDDGLVTVFYVLFTSNSQCRWFFFSSLMVLKPANVLLTCLSVLSGTLTKKKKTLQWSVNAKTPMVRKWIEEIGLIFFQSAQLCVCVCVSYMYMSL